MKTIDIDRAITALLMLCTVVMLGVFFTSSKAWGGGNNNSGFGFGSTRVIVTPEEKKGALVSTVNNSDGVYLIQSRVVGPDGVSGEPESKPSEAPLPFMVTPPLQRSEPHSVQSFRVLTVPGKPLPKDRESLFFLMAKAIPTTPEAQDSNKEGKGVRVVIALQQFIKLFYRPEGLSSDAINRGLVAPKLTLSLSGNQLKVTNPTPYHVTFKKLSVNGKALEPQALRAMVPPNGSQAYALPAGVTSGKAEWQIIDEYGLDTPMVQGVVH